MRELWGGLKLVGEAYLRGLRADGTHGQAAVTKGTHEGGGGRMGARVIGGAGDSGWESFRRHWRGGGGRGP